MSESLLLKNFDLLATAPDGVARLRQLIQTLAVQGKLVPQDSNDELAGELLKNIRAEKDRLIADGSIRLDKPLPPIALGEQPFELPEAWQWVRMGDLVNFSEAGWSPTCIGSPRRSGHWGVLKVSAVSWGTFDANANKELPADLNPRPEYEVKDGDFLLSRANTDELVARSVVVGKSEPRLMLSDKIIRLDVSRLMNRDFLNLCNNAIHSRAHYIANASGTSSSMKNVSREVVLRTPVPLPPFAEQMRIVARVEELMKLCDAIEQKGRLANEQHAQLICTLFDALGSSESTHELAENWQRVSGSFDLLLDRTEAVDALEQTILRLAMRGALVAQDANDESTEKLIVGLLPNRSSNLQTPKSKSQLSRVYVKLEECPFAAPPSWRWVRIEDVCNVQGGIQKTQLRLPVRNHFPYLRVGNVQREKLNLDRIERYELTDDEVEKWALKAGDLLVVEGNGSADEIGRCAIWDGSIEPCVYQNHLMRVRPDAAELVEFLSLYLNSPDGTAEMRRLAITTSGLFNLSVGKIRNIPVPLPPLAEQRRIVDRISKLRGFCAELRSKLQCATDAKSQYAAAIVATAVTAA